MSDTVKSRIEFDQMTPTQQHDFCCNGGRLIDSGEAAAFSEGPLKSVNELAFQIFRHSKEMGKPIEHSDALELARRLQNK